jgi:tetratricopeptide (TPR) repeat protein
MEEMPSHSVTPNSEIFRTLMSRAPDFATARALLDAMLARGLRPNRETFKTLVTLAPDHSAAVELIDLMPEVGVRPDADVFLPLIGHAPDLDTALGWVETMRKRGVSPTGETLTALLQLADEHSRAVALFEELRPHVEPNEGAFKVLIDGAPDFGSGKLWVDRMRGEGMRPEVGVLSSLLAKDLGDLTADDLLVWYLALDHHPSGPMQTAIESFCRSTRVRDALRLCLDYPHLDVSRTVFRQHPEEALAYLGEVLERDPGHANGRYAMGLALLELGRTGDALEHLELAKELARPGPRVAALEEIIRGAAAAPADAG